MCLLEEQEEGIIEELIGDGCTWWKQWFSSIMSWKSSDVDSERVAWVKVHGVPFHAWCFEFFEYLANSMGNFICVDENTTLGANMDIGRFLLRVPFGFNLKEQSFVIVDGSCFNLILREDSYGPVRIANNKGALLIPSSSASSDSEDSWSLPENSSDSEDIVGHFGDSVSNSKCHIVAVNREAKSEEKEEGGPAFESEKVKGVEVSSGKRVVSRNRFDSFNVAVLLATESKDIITKKERSFSEPCFDPISDFVNEGMKVVETEEGESLSEGVFAEVDKDVARWKRKFRRKKAHYKNFRGPRGPFLFSSIGPIKGRKIRPKGKFVNSSQPNEAYSNSISNNVRLVLYHEDHSANSDIQ